MAEFGVIDLGRIYRDRDAYQQNALAQQMGQMQIKKAMKEEADQNALAQIFRSNYKPERTITTPAAGNYDTAEGGDIPAPQTQTIPGAMNMRGALNEMYQRFPQQAMQFEAQMRKAQGETPSSIKEWQLYNAMQPEDRMRYLEMKRSQQFLNLGDQMLLPGTGGAPDRSYRKNLAPGELPSVKGAQAEAEAKAKTGVAVEADKTKKATQASTMTAYIDQANDLLDKASSGYLGTAQAIGKRALNISDDETKANEQLRLVSGWMVANVPRMEGPQSNYDVENYKTMAARVGDSTVPIGDRKAALSVLRELQNKYSALNTGQQGAPTAPKGQIKNISGKTYVNINGKWYAQ